MQELNIENITLDNFKLMKKCLKRAKVEYRIAQERIIFSDPKAAEAAFERDCTLRRLEEELKP